MSCPFCGCDPFHYEDVGLGCELGAEWFDRRTQKDTVTVSWEDFERFANVFEALRTLGMKP